MLHCNINFLLEHPIHSRLQRNKEYLDRIFVDFLRRRSRHLLVLRFMVHHGQHLEARHHCRYELRQDLRRTRCYKAKWWERVLAFLVKQRPRLPARRNPHQQLQSLFAKQHQRPNDSAVLLRHRRRPRSQLGGRVRLQRESGIWDRKLRRRLMYALL